MDPDDFELVLEVSEPNIRLMPSGCAQGVSMSAAVIRSNVSEKVCETLSTKSATGVMSTFGTLSIQRRLDLAVLTEGTHSLLKSIFDPPKLFGIEFKMLSIPDVTSSTLAFATGDVRQEDEEILRLGVKISSSTSVPNSHRLREESRDPGVPVVHVISSLSTILSRSRALSFLPPVSDTTEDGEDSTFTSFAARERISAALISAPDPSGVDFGPLFLPRRRRRLCFCEVSGSPRSGSWPKSDASNSTNSTSLWLMNVMSKGSEAKNANAMLRVELLPTRDKQLSVSLLNMCSPDLHVAVPFGNEVEASSKNQSTIPA
jgi:hypothetical protein